MKPHEPRSGESKEPVISASSDTVSKDDQAGELNELAVADQQGTAFARSQIPQILLEGDQPTCESTTIPSQKYASGPGTASPTQGVALPEAYGTGALWLAARDPHCLYVRWDLTLEQQQQYASRALDRVLQVKVYFENRPEQPVSQIAVRTPSQHSFIHVDVAGARYIAQLGYYETRETWTSVSVSNPVSVPQETVAEPYGVQFATFTVDPALRASSEPVEPSMNVGMVPSAQTEEVLPEPQPVRADLPTLLAEQGGGAPRQMNPGEQWPPVAQVAGPLERKLKIGPEQVPTAPPEFWTEEHEKALAELIGRELSSARAGLLLNPSSPVGPGLQQQQGFWFNLNAELIIYGATEPNAVVTLGGRAVELRADGTFSFRFALPDGTHNVSATACSIGGETRRAELQFARTTRYGNVGEQPPDPGLETPTVQSPS